MNSQDRAFFQTLMQLLQDTTAVIHHQFKESQLSITDNAIESFFMLVCTN